MRQSSKMTVKKQFTVRVYPTGFGSCLGGPVFSSEVDPGWSDTSTARVSQRAAFPEARRVEAACDLMVAGIRELVGRHRYDGVIQDLSPSGVAAGLARIGQGPPPEDAHDRAHLEIMEAGLHWTYGQYQEHRRNPLAHIGALDLSVYDRAYAPAEERQAARATHLAAWPEAIDNAVASLDAVPADVARALLPVAIGLVEGLDPETEPAGPATTAQALAAHQRFVVHLQQLAETGDPVCAIGETALATELGVWDGITVDLEELARRADAERDRLHDLLTEACGRIDPGVKVGELVPRLLADHPDLDGVLAEAATLTREVIEFTREHRLAPYTDGVCLVEPAPPSRSWATAMMSWSGPEETDTPSWYYVTPPDPSWEPAAIEEWLSVFARVTLPAITIHEVAPGHYAHSRALRRLASPVRRQLFSGAFIEGWAHYVEEAVIDEGFRGGDAKYQVGMCLEALVRVTRLACSIGLHTGEMTVEQAAERFTKDAFLGGSAARSEANRGTFDVSYGRYTQGKLAMLELREQARAGWGSGFTLERFHAAVLSLGAPPLGLLPAALRA